MFEYENESDLIALMQNKDQFLSYITQKYTNNNNCTPLEPLIWAIHFNVPKCQRLPILENILLRSIAYIRTCYNFLPEKQILGKTYEALGIPTVCGVPDKCFLNTYKKYKAYYPVKYPKDEILLSNIQDVLLRNVSNDSIENRTSLNLSNTYSTTSTTNQKIISSTPNANRTHNFGINSTIISPIIKTEQVRNRSVAKNSFHEEETSINTRIATQNSSYHATKQIISSPLLQLSGFNVSNETSHYDQNIDKTKTEYFNMDQSSMYFISRDPKCIQTENNISQPSIHNLKDERNQKSLKKEIKDRDNNTTSIYFDNSKKIKHKKSTVKKKSKSNQRTEKKLKQNLNLGEKIKRNLEVKKLWTRNSKTFNKKNYDKSSPRINVETPKQKTNPTAPTYSEQNISESWLRIKQNFDDLSFSDIDKTTLTPLKIKSSSLWTNKFCNKIQQDSIGIELNGTWEENVNNLSQDIQSEKNTIHSLKSFSQESDQKDTNNASNSFNASSISFSDDSVFCPNSTSNSNKLDSIKSKFINWSSDQCDANSYEKSTEKKKVNVLFNNILFKESSRSNSEENSIMSLSSISG